MDEVKNAENLDESNISPVLKRYLESWAAHKEKMTVEEWLQIILAEDYPEYTEEEVTAVKGEIVDSLKQSEQSRASLKAAMAEGRSKESWFAKELMAATSYMGTQGTVRYLNDLDCAVRAANDSIISAATTKAGTINQNPSWDGFYAEHYHVHTFNMNAKAAGSEYRAKVLMPENGVYEKNSVDIGLYDGKGKLVQRYQSKYYKDARATENAQRGYFWSRKMVPADQKPEMSGKTVDTITSPDGISSNPLTKDGAKQAQKEIQSGNWKGLDWNELKAKEVALGIGKHVGQAALMGAAFGVATDVTQKVLNGEEIDGSEAVEAAIKGGADFGVKAATSGAIKYCAEKGIIHMIPKGTPAGTIANIAHVVVENTKVAFKVASGELTVEEGIDEMGQVTVSTVAGIAVAAKGAYIGGQIGMVFGAPGAAVGAFLGGAIGHMVGSKVGQKIMNGARKIKEKAKECVSRLVDGVRDFADTIKSGFLSLFA